MSQVSMYKSLFACSRPTMIATIPLSPNRSVSRNCEPNASGSAITAMTFLIGVAPRCQVELVRFVNELHDPLQPDLVEPLPDQPHLQPAQIGRQVGHRRLQRIAGLVALVLRG